MSKLQVPRVIFQTSIQKQPKYVVDMIMAQSNGWSYLHFNDDEAVDFLKKNPLEKFPNILEKYMSFSNGAHRADLFRYYYLYINGGVFLDSDAIITAPIEQILDAYEFTSIRSYHTKKALLFNGFIGVAKNDPIMLKALENIYSIENEQLVSDYHLICKNLLEIVNNDTRNTIKIYQETRSRFFRPGVITYSNGKKILIHYCYLKKIPEPTNTLKTILLSIIFSNKISFKIYMLMSEA